MRHPQYDESGKLVAHYANEQTDKAGAIYTSAPIPDDHPDLVAWNEARKPKPSDVPDELTLIKARLAALEAKLAPASAAKS